MNKLNKDHLRFHILIAAGVTLVVLFIIVLALRIFTRHGSEFEMPNYIGQQAEQLTQHEGKEGFVFVVNEYRYEEGAADGTVIKQDPGVGEMVKKGRKVYLTVATDEPPTIKMPELREIPFSQAKIILEAQGLKLGSVIEKPSEYENLVLEVLHRGHPIVSGSDIKMGENITLVIGKNVESLPDTLTANTPVEP